MVVLERYSYCFAQIHTDKQTNKNEPKFEIERKKTALKKPNTVVFTIYERLKVRKC